MRHVILTSFHLTGGQDHDLEGADALIDYLTQAEVVLADKACDADERVRQKLSASNCEAVIPFKKNCLNPVKYNRELYKERHLIENFFAKLEQYRGLLQGMIKLLQVS